MTRRNRRPAAWLGMVLLSAGCTAYAEFVNVSPRLEAVDANASGVGVGLQVGQKYAGFVETRLTEDSSNDLQLLEFIFGGRFALLEVNRLKMGLQLDVGTASADLERFRNGNSLVSVGAGVFTEFRLTEPLSIFALGGVRHYWDVTKPTTCNDGWQSGSTGQGTCSHHGGIHHYNDLIGDGTGFEFAVGLRVRF